MALVKLINRVSTNIDERNYNIELFVDLSKAFDTIDHNISLKTLNCHGIRGVNLLLI